MKTSLKPVILPVMFALLWPTVSWASISDFLGNWKNVDANTRGITRMVIKPAGESVRVHVWGRCQPKDCDWGTAKGVAFAPDVSADIRKTAKTVVAEYKKRFAVTTLIMHSSRNRLQVEAFTRFTDNSKRSHYTQIYRFKKTGGKSQATGFKEDCIALDYTKAAVRKVNNRWKITVGSMFLLDFADKRNEARQSLRTIKALKMNKQCFVGRPDPSFEYFLSNNKAPRGTLPREDCLKFNPKNIEVKKVRNRWTIVDGSHMMFSFDGKAKEAKQAYRIIKKYRFTQSCFVGRPGPSMSYLKR